MHGSSRFNIRTKAELAELGFNESILCVISDSQVLIDMLNDLAAYGLKILKSHDNGSDIYFDMSFDKSEGAIHVSKHFIDTVEQQAAVTRFASGIHSALTGNYNAWWFCAEPDPNDYIDGGDDDEFITYDDDKLLGDDTEGREKANRTI